MLSLHAIAMFFQSATRHSIGLMAILRHLGAPGLLLLAVLDSTPIPTLGGPDILNMILAVRHVEPWYFYAAAATLGSVVGAYVTYRIARDAGSAFLESKFGVQRVAMVLKYFEKWGTGILVFSSLIPFPFPTSAFFAAAGVLNYPARKFTTVVATARAGRYFALAALASYYGRHFIRMVRHPTQHPGWILLLGCLVCLLASAALFVQRTARRQTT